MKCVTSRKAGILALVAMLAACDNDTAAPPNLEPAATVIAATCDVVPGLKSQARAYLPRGQFAGAEAQLVTLSKACAGGEVSGTTAAAWQLLRLVESIAAAGTGVDLAAGSAFVNGLLACTVSRCDSSALPSIDFSGALGPAGVFAVRAAGDPNNAVAHGTVGLVDFSGNPVQALWGVEVTRPWPQVVFVPIVLVYGAPASNLSLQELSIGDLQLALNVFPDAGQFRDGALQVGLCFSADIVLPHLNDDDTQPSLVPKLQRENVLLEERTPGFCPTSGASQASIAGALPNRLRNLLATVLPSLRSDRRITVIGGTPLDFSTFAPVAVNPQGGLEIVSQPNASIQRGQSIGTYVIRALSGAGTPIEKVSVALWVVGPSGTVNGALAGSLRKPTTENDAAFGTVMFDNLFVGPPGDYRICAVGSLADFTFRAVCSSTVQVN